MDIENAPSTKINLKLSNSTIGYVHFCLDPSSKRFPRIYLLMAIFIGFFSLTVVYAELSPNPGHWH